MYLNLNRKNIFIIQNIYLYLLHQNKSQIKNLKPIFFLTLYHNFSNKLSIPKKQKCINVK